MAEKKKLVSEITSMDVDFAQWYTDICTKAQLVEYFSVKGFVVLAPLLVKTVPLCSSLQLKLAN